MIKGRVFLERLGGGSPEDCLETLQNFYSENDKAREISWLSIQEKEKLWRIIFDKLRDMNANDELLTASLNSLRILSRDKETLEKVMTDDYVKCLLFRAGLECDQGPTGTDNLVGMKVIFNMIFQSEVMQAMFISNGALKCLVQHSNVSQTHIPAENRFFLLRLLFIITALKKNSGAIVRKELNGLEVLLDLMDSVGPANVREPADNMTVDLISEILKILYNIIHDIFPNREETKGELMGAEFPLYRRLCGNVRKNLVTPVVSPEKKIELSVHSIHLLCALPPECYEELLKQDCLNCNEGGDGFNLNAIEFIVQCLEVKLDNEDSGPAVPIIVAMTNICRNREIRRYMKRRILPVLTKEDLKKRPEVGTSIRNRLCALIHKASGYATEVAANFIFILCKENVNKMVKYTGYGNAAGLLANRGLMMGDKGNGNYSDDSENSDTEEYSELKNKINDVEGWLKPETPELEMTDEQKEHEAMKLVDAINKLTTGKAIRPCRVGPDGKPQPIEHVLELQDPLETSFKSMGRITTSDSDSD